MIILCPTRDGSDFPANGREIQADASTLIVDLAIPPRRDLYGKNKYPVP
jgi:hypothetical protein